MNIVVTQTGAQEVGVRIANAPAAYAQVVEQKMGNVVNLLYGRVREHLDGETLQRRSGELYDSIQKGVTTTENTVVGTVWTDSLIASIHERGGTTRPHEIVPVNARALRFVAGKIFFTRDDVVFASKVNHPGSRIPQRSFMAASLSECVSLIGEMLRLSPRIGF